MSQLFALPSLELLLIAGRAVALVLGLLIFAWAFRHWRRAASRDTQRVFEQLDLVRSELLIMKEVIHHSSHNGEGGAGQRAAYNRGQYNLGQPNQVLFNPNTANHGSPNQTAAHSTTRAQTTSGGAARGYEIAARMARNGAAKDELIRNCGVTAHEAELLVKLHGQRRPAGADLIGKQPRVIEPANQKDLAVGARQTQPSNPLMQTSRQTATAPRQASAAPAAQRTQPKNQPLPARSRLVAVG